MIVQLNNEKRDKNITNILLFKFYIILILVFVFKLLGNFAKFCFIIFVHQIVFFKCVFLVFFYFLNP